MPVRRKKGKKAAPKKQSPYKMPPPFPAGEVILDPNGKKWRIGPSIGVGGFGEIYSACEFENGEKGETEYPYVIKIEPYENGPLFVEMHFYMRNAKQVNIEEFMKSRGLSSLGMPEYYGTGDHMYKEEQFRFIVLERYGKDLKKIFQEAGAFKAPTVFQLGLQMLDVLDYIHSRGYVHADLKGANILLGLKEGTENQAYLVDYGLASRLNEEEEFNPDPRCAHNGTIEYTSRDAHLGEPTKRGDLEILAFNLLQWAVGALPWEAHAEKPHKVHTMKKNLLKNARTLISQDYPDVPDELIQFFEYIMTLEPKDQPDYTKCKQIFENYLNSVGKTRTSILDFTPNEKVLSAKSAAKELDNGKEELSADTETIENGSKEAPGANNSADDENDSKKASSANSTADRIENDTLNDDSMIDEDEDIKTPNSNPTSDKIKTHTKKAGDTSSGSIEEETDRNKELNASAASVDTESDGKRPRRARRANPVLVEDTSDDDKPLKPSSAKAKRGKGRKRKSDPKEKDGREAKVVKSKESTMRLIDNPTVRRLRSWDKRDELIKALH